MSPPVAVQVVVGRTGVAYSSGVALTKRPSSAVSAVIVVLAVTSIGPTSWTPSLVLVALMRSSPCTAIVFSPALSSPTV